MTRRRSACLLAGALAASLLLPAEPAVAVDRLEQARQAAERLQFVGGLTVWWETGKAGQRSSMQVRGSGGSIAVDGSRDATAWHGQRYLSGERADWSLLWPGSTHSGDAPALHRKYRATERAGPPVADRVTTQVELFVGDELRERLFVDVATGLLLRREQLHEDGRVRRMVGFDWVVLRPEAEPAPPPEAADDAPEPVAPGRLGAPYAAPADLDGGYHRIGAYHRSGTVHLVYSDGLYGLSVFEQPGRMDPDELPSGGTAVQVGPHDGWAWQWAGGSVVTWQAGPTTLTAVGDAPTAEVVAAASSVPGPPSPSLVQRLRRASRGLVEAVSSTL